MVEGFQRTHTDRTTYGYRQLPGSGSAGGPELKTLVIAGLGAALGIIVGTILAGNSIRGTNPGPSLHSVQAGSIASALVAPPAAKPVKAPPVDQPVAQPGSRVASVGQNSIPVKASAAKPVTVSLDYRAVHSLTTRKRHLARHWHHPRRRPHSSLLASIPAGAPPVLDVPKSDESAKPFVFTVEGDVSLANFDALSKTIDTYEGESFALNQAPSGSSDIAWQDNVPNIHYRCDQSGNCDLVRAGQAFLNSKRTR
jgi:hypothetical protein